MNDALGDRMKANYEDVTRLKLPRRTYTIVRIDGNAFHTYTKNFKRPFDEDLITNFNYAALETMNEMMGVQLAYLQSDEISILLTDFAEPNTEAWFNGNIQKIVSVAASTYGMYFNYRRLLSNKLDGYAVFDARVFTIPDRTEVENYFIWRQNDASRNSVSQCARSLYSHKELDGKTSQEMQELLFQKGVNWDEYPIHLKRGRVLFRCRETALLATAEGAKPWVTEKQDTQKEFGNWYLHNKIPVFTQDRTFLRGLIPEYK